MAGRRVRAPFEDADADGDFADLVAYLDNLERIPVVAELKAWIAASVAADQPQFIAEIGCGNGDMSARIARICPDRELSLGFDFSEKFVRMSRARHDERDLFFVVSDAARLPVATGTLDALFIERVLMHIADPAAVIAEAARVLGDDGRLVVCETHWQTLVVDHPDGPLTTRILGACIDTMVSPTIGRDLEQVAAQCGFAISDTETFHADIAARDTDILLNFARMRGFAVAAGVPERDADRWIDDLGRMDIRTQLTFKVVNCRKA
jgi:ubiquinone/menaquinone biosynthesis C-methylase UbiE